MVFLDKTRGPAGLRQVQEAGGIRFHQIGSDLSFLFGFFAYQKLVLLSLAWYNQRSLSSGYLCEGFETQTTTIWETERKQGGPGAPVVFLRFFQMLFVFIILGKDILSKDSLKGRDKKY